METPCINKVILSYLILQNEKEDLPTQHFGTLRAEMARSETRTDEVFRNSS